MELNLHLVSRSRNNTLLTTLNQSSTELLCSIYQAAPDCDCETQTCVYGWFFVIFTIATLIIGITFVLRTLQQMLTLIEKETEETRATRRRLFHLH